MEKLLTSLENFFNSKQFKTELNTNKNIKILIKRVDLIFKSFNITFSIYIIKKLVGLKATSLRVGISGRLPF